MPRRRVEPSDLCASIAIHQPHFRRQPPIELMEPVGSEPLDFGEHACGGLDERGDVDALASRRERRKIPRSARQHVHCAVVVAFPQVMKGDTDLKDPLIQTTHVTPLGAP